MNVRALIVEDEPPARRALRDFIADFDWLRLVGEAGEMGKLADLVLLDADPLADIRHTRRIRAVAANERLLTREMLDQMLQKAESRNVAAPKK